MGFHVAFTCFHPNFIESSPTSARHLGFRKPSRRGANGVRHRGPAALREVQVQQQEGLALAAHEAPEDAHENAVLRALACGPLALQVQLAQQEVQETGEPQEKISKKVSDHLLAMYDNIVDFYI